MDAIGEQNLSFNRGVVLSQGLICTKRVHMGLSEEAFIKAVAGGGGGGGSEEPPQTYRKVHQKVH